jgi:hypothetical protein
MGDCVRRAATEDRIAAGNWHKSLEGNSPTDPPERPGDLRFQHSAETMNELFKARTIAYRREFSAGKVDGRSTDQWRCLAE